MLFDEFLTEADTVDERGLKSAFLDALPSCPSGEALFEEARQEFEGPDLVAICGEIVETIRADCGGDQYCRWDYDHLEFIILLSNRYPFSLPTNFLNGLPEQLILLVDSRKIVNPCEDQSSRS